MTQMALCLKLVEKAYLVVFVVVSLYFCCNTVSVTANGVSQLSFSCVPWRNRFSEFSHNSVRSCLTLALLIASLSSG